MLAREFSTYSNRKLNNLRTNLQIFDKISQVSNYPYPFPSTQFHRQRSLSSHTKLSNQPVYNNNNTPHQRSPFDNPQPLTKNDYQVLLEYELKRQKQKNVILNERLKNKELFIIEMKAIQEQLTLSYSQCQEELNTVNQKIYQFQMVGVREFKEQIQQLKHQLFRKEQENQILRNDKQIGKQRGLNNAHNSQASSSPYIISKHSSLSRLPKPHNPLQNYNNKINSKNSSRMIQRHQLGEKSKSSLISKYNSNQINYFYPLNKNLNHEEIIKRVDGQYQSNNNNNNNNNDNNNSNNNNNKNKYKQKSKKKLIISVDNNQQLNKNSTISNKISKNYNKNTQHVSNFQIKHIKSRYQQNQFNSASQFQKQILNNLQKVTNFLKHFMEMCRCYLNFNNQDRLIHQLKHSWRWIKDVVKEWDQFKKNNIERQMNRQVIETNTKFKKQITGREQHEQTNNNKSQRIQGPVMIKNNNREDIEHPLMNEEIKKRKLFATNNKSPKMNNIQMNEMEKYAYEQEMLLSGQKYEEKANSQQYQMKNQ